jgi:hypothetical protein
MSIQEWGQVTWYLFHTLAEKIRPEYFNEEKGNIFKHINNICSILPCPDCKSHALNYLKNINSSMITNKEQLKLFLMNFHNNVNSRHQKKLFTIEEVNNKYKHANLYNIINGFLKTYNKPSGTMRINLLGTLDKKRNLKEFTSWIQSIFFKFF